MERRALGRGKEKNMGFNGLQAGKEQDIDCSGGLEGTMELLLQLFIRAKRRSYKVLIFSIYTRRQ